jgi:hypothetical protein
MNRKYPTHPTLAHMGLRNRRVRTVGGSPEAMRSAAGYRNFGFTVFPIADAQISELGHHPKRTLNLARKDV